jgi:hypothetical protein
MNHMRASGLALALAAVIAAGACASVKSRTPATTAPAAAGTPPSAATPATTAPAPTRPDPLPAMASGTYLSVYDGGSEQLFVLRPGATKWQFFANVPRPALAAGRSVVASSPDPRHLLVWADHDSSLYSAAGDGTAQHLIARAPHGGIVCGHALSPRGDRLYYSIATADLKHVTVYTARLDGTDRRVVPEADTFASCYPGWSGDGRTLVFTRTYSEKAPVREHHEVYVSTGGRTHEVALALPDNVWADQITAVSADGHTAVVAGMTVKPDGTCGDADDTWFLADLRTGAVTHLVAPHSDFLAGTALIDRSGRVLADMSGNGYLLGVFDPHGRFVKAVAGPDGTDEIGKAQLWTTVA